MKIGERRIMTEIIIIGGGVAGLSAGIYAQLNGFKATICEKHNIAGGNLTGWQRGKFHIDNCIHWLTGTNPNSNHYKMWKDLNVLGNTKIYQPKTLYTYEEKGIRISLDKDLAQTQQDMLTIAPEDKKEIFAFFKAIKMVQGIMGIAGDKHDKKSDLFQKLISFPTLYKYYRMSTGDLAKLFKNRILQGFITSMLGTEFAAIALLIVFATFGGENGGIPYGSSVAMAERMTNRFLSLGGTLHLKKEAIKITNPTTNKQIVEFSDGSTISGDYVIIATELPHAFEKLLNLPLPKQFLSQLNNPKMLRFSSYQCAFSCKEEKLPFSGDFIFKLTKELQKKLKTENLILREFSHEASFAPKGYNVIQTLTFCKEEDCINFINLRKKPQKYAIKKAEIAAAIQSAIEKKFPQLAGKLECIDVWTPATYNRYTNAETGAYMGFLFPPKTRPKQLNNTVKQRPNVILASQWLHAPGGLPIAASVGKNAVTRILEYERKNKSKTIPKK